MNLEQCLLLNWLPSLHLGICVEGTYILRASEHTVSWQWASGGLLPVTWGFCLIRAKGLVLSLGQVGASHLCPSSPLHSLAPCIPRAPPPAKGTRASVQRHTHPHRAMLQTRAWALTVLKLLLLKPFSFFTWPSSLELLLEIYLQNPDTLQTKNWK